MPPLLPWSAASQDLGVPAALCSCWSDPDGQKDAENRDMVGNDQDMSLCVRINYAHMNVPHILYVDIYVPGSGSPPQPPCHGHGQSPSTPLPPMEWVGPVGRGGGYPTSNQQQMQRVA